MSVFENRFNENRLLKADEIYDYLMHGQGKLCWLNAKRIRMMGSLFYTYPRK